MKCGEIHVAIVSTYPPRGSKHASGSGVSSYAKNLAEALAGIRGLRIGVIAPYDSRARGERVYYEKNVRVKRCFRLGRLYLVGLLRCLASRRPSIVHFQHEYFLYGGYLSSLLYPIMVAISRLLSRRVVVTIHHGVFPLKSIDDEGYRSLLGIRGPPSILKAGLLLVTRLLGLLSDKIIVHEGFMKESLSRDYRVPAEKIIVIPHGVEEARPMDKLRARELLGVGEQRIALFFGYLARYKGLEELVEEYASRAVYSPVSSILIIAGGPHPRLSRSESYRSWLLGFLRRVAYLNQRLGGKGRIMVTGYLPESALEAYFSAADMVILPYKVRFSASGPESLALSHGKCFSRDLNAIGAFLGEEAEAFLYYCKRGSLAIRSRRLWDRVALEHLRKAYSIGARR